MTGLRVTLAFVWAGEETRDGTAVSKADGKGGEERGAGGIRGDMGCSGHVCIVAVME